MKLKLQKCVEDLIQNSETILVFPSEIVTQRWRKYAARYVKRAVSREQFISWDFFKAQVQKVDSERHASNELFRQVFGFHLAQRNSSENFLRYCIPPAMRQHYHGFIAHIVSSLTLLPKICDLLETYKQDYADLYHDIQIIYMEYSNFLDIHMRYEPSWEELSLHDTGVQYAVFFPELLEDYIEYSTFLQESSSITVYTHQQLCMQSEENNNCISHISIYTNMRHEICATLDEIEHLLDRGVMPDDIVVTMGGLQYNKAFFEREAAIRDIPLHTHSGQLYSEYGAGKLFAGLQEQASSCYSYESCMALWLESSIAWKERALLQYIVEQGVQYTCAYNTKQHDYWEEILQYELEKVERAFQNRKTKKRQHAYDRAEAALAYYRAYVIDASAIINAQTAKQLRKAVLQFATRQLQVAKWDKYNHEIWNELIKILDELLRLEDMGIIIEKPFILWNSIIKDKKYVIDKKHHAVALYPYQVSAGIWVPYHFVINVSDAYTYFEYQQIPYVDIQMLTDDASKFSAGYMHVHQGLGTKFSANMQDYSAVQNPAVHHFASNERMDIPLSDAMQRELNVWCGADTGVTAVQQKSYDLFHIRMKLSGTYVSDKQYKHNAITRIVDNIEPPENVELSASGLATYMRCSYEYVWSYIMGITNRKQISLSFNNALGLGSLYHAVLDKLYSEHKGDKVSALREVRIDIPQNLYLSAGLFRGFAPLYQDLVTHYIQTIIMHDADSYADDEHATEAYIEYSEAEFAALPVTESIYVQGRIDRVLRRGKDYVIHDYKRKKLPGYIELGLQDSTTIKQFQMALYAYYWQSEYGINRLAELGFISIENKERYMVYSEYGGKKKNLKTEDELSVYIEQVMKKITDIGQCILYNEYSLHDSEYTQRYACKNCTFLRVCRHGLSLL